MYFSIHMILRDVDFNTNLIKGKFDDQLIVSRCSIGSRYIPMKKNTSNDPLPLVKNLLI